MGIVTDYLRSTIEKEVDRPQGGLVVWFDPEEHYREFAETLSLPDTAVALYRDSFFALRHEIEPHIRGDTRPRLVIYVPLDQRDTQHALCEAEAAGVTMAPGQQPPQRNTRLAVVARNALRERVGERALASLEKQIEEGKLTLAELDRLAERGITRGVVSVVFGTDAPMDIALSFLSDESRDTQIARRSALPELVELLDTALGLPESTAETPKVYRARVARHVLCTDLVASLSGDPPDSFATMGLPPTGPAREACVNLARTWRARRDLRDSYAIQANTVAQAVGLGALDLCPGVAGQAETFREVEQCLQHDVEQGLLDAPTAELVALATKRQSSFWSEQEPKLQARWALVALAGRLLLEAERVDRESKAAGSDPMAYLRAYAEGETPWCLLDTHHRHLERHWHRFEAEPGDLDGRLEQLVSAARNRYSTVSGDLAERFLRAYSGGSLSLPETPKQIDVFTRWVRKGLTDRKTAYLLVDALRFEMARELALSLGDNLQCTVEWVTGAVPGLTEIGMGALVLPEGASPVIVPAGEGKLALRAGDVVLRGRGDRLKYLADHAGVSVCEAKLDQMLPSPKKRLRESIVEAGLILVTSQEIDALCEGDNVHLARRIVDDLLADLGRAVRVLTDLGVERVVVAADHGYLFGEEVADALKIDAPGGDTKDLHRRVWVGAGGSADQSYLRAKLSSVGMGGDLDFAVPWGTACFKVQGGGRAYFHGGLSLPEHVVPVLTVSRAEVAKAAAPSEITWTLTGGSETISTRFFSVTVEGRVAGLFEVTVPRVRVEMREAGKCLSQPVSASYGLEEGTGCVRLRLSPSEPKAIDPNTVALMVVEEPKGKMVSVHLIDVATDRELARMDEVRAAISM